MIDLRSDTVTRPTRAMREAMAGAEVGDDVYREDPTVNRLERRVADLLGKDDAVFVTSGTLSNQIALRAHASPGDLALMHRAAHMVINEGGAAAAVGGVTCGRLDGERGIFGPDDVVEALGVDHPFNPPNHAPRPRLVCVENSHNEGGGAVWPVERLRAVAGVARAHGLAVHMDGARLWHAAAATGQEPAAWAAHCDTVSVCFSKGLGAPVGSALAGPARLVEVARRYKQQMGGGLRQGGVLAAAALHALDHHRERLVDDVEHARRFARALAEMDGVEVDAEAVETNIVRFRVTRMEAGSFVDACHAAGVHMLPGGRHGVRAVFHLDVGPGDVDSAARVIAEVLSRTGEARRGIAGVP